MSSPRYGTAWDDDFSWLYCRRCGARVAPQCCPILRTSPLQLWLGNTSATSANFTPAFGHRYTFVVTATDNVRNTGQGTATTDAIQVTKYYYLGSSRVAMRRRATAGTEVTYLHTDHLGTVSVATSQSQTVLARTLNMPYGSVRWSSGTLPTDYGFTGMKDTGLGLVYLHARYYASWVGRFVSADTVAPDEGNPQDLNRYGYVQNNPLRYRDPSGHKCTEDELGERAGSCNPKSYPPLPPSHYLCTESYGCFDRGHIGAGSPAKLLADVEDRIRHGGGEVSIKQPSSIWKFTWHYRGTYYVSAKEQPTREYIERVALGIFLDYEQKFEAWQALLDWPIGVVAKFTSFAVEDLPSDYLGFVMAARGLSLEEAFAYLDSSPISTDTSPSRDVRNYTHYPLVNNVHVRWPKVLEITPVTSASDTWAFVGDWGSNFITEEIDEVEETIQRAVLYDILR